ncbi:hypothetical protein EC957_011734 [Mortierella hygrophila]|uniref:Uncharacterized protein n=1 Tax=Mortierella hygrophila TaxID=979708 RepID=A0A9P6F8H5_9FUNG|nr:hypothetical protein EC957_011734 [Mortierella hygrophila]
MKPFTVVSVILVIVIPCTLFSTAALSNSPPQFHHNSQQQQHPTTTDDSDLQLHVAQRDKAFSASVVYYYEELLGDSNFTIHARGLEAAILSSEDVGRFCVGISSNPVRVQIFNDRTSCDDNHWTTLYVFTAYKKKDEHYARRPICVGHNDNPDRSMLFAGRTACTANGWSNDFSFYESGCAQGGVKDDGCNYELTVMWEAFEPHRMMLYPHYGGHQHGWQEAYSLTYKSRWRPATVSEVKLLKPHLPTHSTLHKRTDIHPPYDLATLRCAQALIRLWSYNRASNSTPRTIRGDIDPQFGIDARRGGFTPFAGAAFLRLHYNKYGGATAVDVMVEGYVRASATIPYETNLSVSGVRLALQESLRSGRPVPVVPHDDHEAGDVLIGMIDDSIVVFGGTAVFSMV